MAGIARRGRGRRTVNEINMVPFIDVMLVLLIIFMVTAPMVTPGVINAPTVGKADQTPPETARVYVDPTGKMEWEITGQGKQTATLEQVKELAREWQAKQLEQGKTQEQFAIVIVGDKQASYEYVMNTMTALQEAQIKRVAFLLNQK
ncbi:protein TolR [Lampropedia puyangensis]|uniref:Protein TolR n=1 Tax=Lampropedia puyangensis TaxID=1330072 RepID=A0A4S8F6M5_9BURK|nr:biopolymer transporter ExbD [Lampropedia puyangensis]THU02541.1 protein TolR [Lampropedia puyangensis]